MDGPIAALLRRLSASATTGDAASRGTRHAMCFSASASFLTAAVTGAAGAYALKRTRSPREWPLASMPMFFAVQQGVEGALWLALPAGSHAPVCVALTDTFLVFALLFWPLFAPFAAWTIEDDAARRHAILACLITGAGVSAYLASVLLGSEHQAILLNGHIIYDSQPPPNPAIGIPYLIATGLSLALSSHRAVNLLSLIVVSGSVLAWFAYWDAFVSVWCFFAAGGSAVIAVHFERARTRAVHAPGTQAG